MRWTAMKIFGGRAYGRRLDSGTTLMVVFDKYNWTASYQHPKQPTVYLEDGFPTAEAAKEAVLKRAQS